MIRSIITGTHTRVICPNCHIDNVDSYFNFCNVCGLKLDKIDEPHHMLMCDSCKSTRVKESDRFCPHCGTNANSRMNVLEMEKV